jgi:streptogramin lyase
MGSDYNLAAANCENTSSTALGDKRSERKPSMGRQIMRMGGALLAIGAAVVVLLMVVAVASGLEIQEAILAGMVTEINPGTGEQIFVSNPGTSEIWEVDATGAYTVYENVPGVMDAKPDASGNIWFTDGGQMFGQIDVASEITTTWTIVGAEVLGGLAFDDQGKVWLTQFFGQWIYSFDPATTELCTYTLFLGAPSDYIVHGDGYLWLASWGQDKAYQLDTTNSLYRAWSIKRSPTDNPRPLGLAVDSEGMLWWTDTTWDKLVRLDPALSEMTTYDLPLGSEPQLVTSQAGGLWYTEGTAGTFGFLRMGATADSTYTLSVSTPTVLTPAACTAEGLGPGSPLGVTTRHGTLIWQAPYSLAPAVDDGEWTVYQLPSTSRQPYGIAASGGFVWIGDQGQDKLVRFPRLHPEGTLSVEKGGPAKAEHGETITFTYQVRYESPDGSPARNLVVVDDRCAPVTGPDPAGDTNANGLLDVGERWEYACTTTMPPHSEGEEDPMINTAVATGEDPDGDPVTAGMDSHATRLHGQEIYLPIIVSRSGGR